MGSLVSKRIVGEMPVESDGSAAFIVPARKPLYFQLIDANGCAIQSMRSWVTLQPGERFPCYGCHEDKNVAPPTVLNPIANTAKELEPFYNIKNDYFSFPRYIQPLLDTNCTSCHTSIHSSRLDLSGTTFWTGTLTSDNDNKTACRNWSNAYYNLTTGIAGFVANGNYVTIKGLDVNAPAEGLQPNSFGSQKSALITKLKGGHVQGLPGEVIDKIAAWIDLAIPYSGYYSDDMKPSDSAAYVERVKKTRGVEELLEEANIQDFIKDGGYGAYVNTIDHRGWKNGSRFVLPGAERIKVRFSQSGQKLIVRASCEGKLILLDMRGRRIMACDVAKKSSIIPLRTKLPTGLYIVKFTGAGVNEQRIVSAL
jgi:hypothetical protein